MSKQFSLCICRSYINMSRNATCRIAHKSVLKIYKTWELPPRFALLATNKAMPWTHWGPKGGPRPPAFWAPFENSLIRQYLLWLSLYSIIILLNVKVHQLPSADLIWMKSCWFFFISLLINTNIHISMRWDSNFLKNKIIKLCNLFLCTIYLQ